jgi:hypothetical protein
MNFRPVFYLKVRLPVFFEQFPYRGREASLVQYQYNDSFGVGLLETREEMERRVEMYDHRI